MIAIESRIKAPVLNSGGLYLEPTASDADPFNFLPMVRVPTRMVNYPSDCYFPIASSQKSCFDYLGTDQKDHVLVAEDGHGVPLNDLARATLDGNEQHLQKLPQQGYFLAQTRIVGCQTATSPEQSILDLSPMNLRNAPPP